MQVLFNISHYYYFYYSIVIGIIISIVFQLKSGFQTQRPKLNN